MPVDQGGKIVMTMPEELHVHVHLEDGSYWATVLEFPGVFAAGDTMDELRASLEEGLGLYLEDEVRGVPTVRLTDWHVEPLETTARAELVCA